MAQTGDALVDIELDASAGGAAEASSSSTTTDTKAGNAVVIDEAINVGEGQSYV